MLWMKLYDFEFIFILQDYRLDFVLSICSPRCAITILKSDVTKAKYISIDLVLKITIKTLLGL